MEQQVKREIEIQSNLKYVQVCFFFLSLLLTNRSIIDIRIFYVFMDFFMMNKEFIYYLNMHLVENYIDVCKQKKLYVKLKLLE